MFFSLAGFNDLFRGKMNKFLLSILINTQRTFTISIMSTILFKKTSDMDSSVKDSIEIYSKVLEKPHKKTKEKTYYEL